MKPNPSKIIQVIPWLFLAGVCMLLICGGCSNQNDLIYQNVISQEGYSLEVVQPVSIKFAVQPEWLTANDNWNIQLTERDDTAFILDRTERVGGNVKFNIAIRPLMNPSAGKFVSNQAYQEDGNHHYYARAPLWRLTVANEFDEQPDVIGTGQGDLRFSFLVNEQAAKKWAKQGMTVEYFGLLLYAYSKK